MSLSTREPDFFNADNKSKDQSAHSSRLIGTFLISLSLKYIGLDKQKFSA